MARTGKASLLIVFVTVFIDLLGFGIVLPLLPRYGEHFGADKMQLGLLMASFSAMQFLFAPLWGRLSDRVGRRPILILGLAGSTASYALFGYATSLGNGGTLLGFSSLAWLYATRIGAGIAGATISTAQAYIADVTGTHDRAKGMALIGAAFGIGFTFGPLLGAMFVPPAPRHAQSAAVETTTAESAIPKEGTTAVAVPDVAPSAAPGYVAAVLSGVALLCAVFVLPESLVPGTAPRELHWFDLAHLRTALARPSVGLLLGTMFLTTFAFAQFETTLSLLTQSLGMDARRNFLVFAYIGFVLALGQGMIVRRLLPKWGEHRMGLVGAALMTAGLAAIGWVAQHGSLGLFYAVLPISVLGFSALTPSLQALLSLNSSAADQGGILGMGQSMSALARILGPLAGLPLFGLGKTYPYFGGAALMLVGLLLVGALRGPRAETAPGT